MPTITDSAGRIFNLDTGEIVGQAEVKGDQANIGDKPYNLFGTSVDLPSEVVEPLRQLSWAANSALFFIPDGVTRTFGRMLGMKDENVQTLSKIFNKGERAPKNATERYTRAIGQGIGGVLPITGILGWAAATRPVVQIADRGKSVIKDIANDALDYYAKNPRKATMLDLTFGSAYEVTRQAVEEQVSDDDPNKQLYKEIIPASLFLGLPAAVSLAPSMLAAARGQKAYKAATQVSTPVQQEVLNNIKPQLLARGPFKILPKMMIDRAKKKITNVFGEVGDSPDAQEAIKQLELALTDPRIKGIFDLGDFGFAEKTMYPALLKEQAEILQRMGPEELANFKALFAENQNKLSRAFQALAPNAGMDVRTAFQNAVQTRKKIFDGLLAARENLTSGEIAAFSQRFGPANIDMMNNELRGALMSVMEGDLAMRNNVLRQMGLRQAFDKQGNRVSVRDEDGMSLFPAVNIEDDALKLIEKYTPKAAFGVDLPVPEPIRKLQQYVAKQQAKQNEAKNDAMASLIDDEVKKVKELLLSKGYGDERIAEIDEALRSEISAVITGRTKDAKAKAAWQKAVKAGQTEFAIPSLEIIPRLRGTYKINRKSLLENAEIIAKDTATIDMNAPEALDLINAANRARIKSVQDFNRAVASGRTTLTDAQAILDRGKNQFADIEQFVMKNAPLIDRRYSGMQAVIDDYREGFERTLPFILTSKKKGGLEFYTPNERLMDKVFESGTNIRQLRNTLGTQGQQLNDLLEQGAVDWLRKKAIFDKDGAPDAKKIQAVFDKNKSIIDALPENIRLKLTDEVAFAEDYAKRMGQLEQREVAAKDAELDRLLRTAARPDSNPQQILSEALEDPAKMRKLVDEVGKDKDALDAMRRAVYDFATRGAEKRGGALQTFIQGNAEDSLKILFEPKHLEDLKKLADIQRRVMAFGDVTGQIPAFEATDDMFQRLFGSGIKYVVTTAREAAVGRINPTSGALFLGIRLANGVEKQVFDRIMMKALMDKNFASDLVQIGTPSEALKVFRQLEQLGVGRKTLRDLITAPATQRGLVLEAYRAADEENLEEAREPRRPSAAEMLRNLGPAPKARGTGTTAQPAARGISYQPKVQGAQPGQAAMMYQQLFPQDPLGTLAMQRRMMGQ